MQIEVWKHTAAVFTVTKYIIVFQASKFDVCMTVVLTKNGSNIYLGIKIKILSFLIAINKNKK